MRYFWRIFFWILGAAVLVAAVLAVMLVISSHEGDLYDSRVKIAFNAAALDYEPGDPAHAVMVTYEGDTIELDPDAYRALSFYMRLGATKAYLPCDTDAEKIEMVICGTDEVNIYRISDEEAYVAFRSSGKTMKMKIRGDGLWKSLAYTATRAAKSCGDCE